MSKSEGFGRGDAGFLGRWVGGGLLLMGSVLALLGMFWFPFKSECTFSEYPDALMFCTRSWTEWQYALDWDRGFWFFIPFIFVVLFTIFALLLGVSQVFERGGPLRRLRLRFGGRFIFLLILAFLAQWFAAVFVTAAGLNPCPPSFYFGCRDVFTYTALRDEVGVRVAFVGLALLLAYTFAALAYRFIARIGARRLVVEP